MVDKRNAHTRGATARRQSADVKSEEAKRLLDDPAFIRAYDAVREGLMKELEEMQSDGSSTVEDYEREICRSLRSLRSIRRALALGVQGQTLRLAEFRATETGGS